MNSKIPTVENIYNKMKLNVIDVTPNTENISLADEGTINAFRDGSLCVVQFSFVLLKSVLGHKTTLFRLASGFPKPAKSFMCNECKVSNADGAGRIGVSSDGFLGFYNAPSDLPINTRVDGSFIYPISKEEE